MSPLDDLRKSLARSTKAVREITATVDQLEEALSLGEFSGESPQSARKLLSYDPAAT